MSDHLRRILATAALVAATALPSVAEAPSPGIFGDAVLQAILDDILAARETEKDAFAYLQVLRTAGFRTIELDSPEAEALDSFLQSSMASLESAQLQILAAPGLPGRAEPEAAQRFLDGARGRDEAVSIGPRFGDGIDQMIASLSAALADKSAAYFSMVGIHVTPKDEAALEANPDPPAWTIDPDVRSLRDDCSVTRRDQADGTGDVLDAGCRSAKEKPPDAAGPGKMAKPPVNYYYGFTGKKPTPGYIFRNQERPLFGPFEVSFQVGAFDPRATSDTGSACLEFDLQGSSPLRFLAVCGRRIGGGVQVFAQSHEGAAGSLYFEGVRIARVRVRYDGTSFTCSAAGDRDAPDEGLQEFASYGLAQGETPLELGIGASGLLKGAEIGLDEIYITPM